MKGNAIFAAACLALAAAGDVCADGISQGAKDKFLGDGDGPGSDRAVVGKVQKDGALDICIGKKESNAIRCLNKFGYLGGGARDASIDGLETGGGNRVGYKQGLLSNPGERIKTPTFNTLGGGSRYGSKEKEEASGSGGGAIGIGAPEGDRYGETGIRSSQKDKAPSKNKKFLDKTRTKKSTGQEDAAP